MWTIVLAAGVWMAMAPSWRRGERRARSSRVPLPSAQHSGRSPAATHDALLIVAGALLVATAAGLNLRASLSRAAASLDPARAAEVEALLRQAGHLGLAAALARSKGSLSPLFGRLARAHLSGAPLAATITGFVAEERDLYRAVRTEAARKLPVRLTIPLALLVLPGFVLLTVGPAAVGSLQRLLGPLLP